MAFRPSRTPAPTPSSLERSPLFAEYLTLLSTDGKKMELQDHEPIGPMDALLVIDMQNDFVPCHPEHNPHGGAFGVAEGWKAIKPCVNMISQATQVGAHIIATRDYHPHDHASFDTDGGPFPSHCVQGSEGSKLLLPIAQALAESKTANPELVQIAFKAFHEDVDSFGGLPYKEGPVYKDGGQGRVSHREPGDKVEPLHCPIAHGCTKTPWTGAMLLKQSQLQRVAKNASQGMGEVTAADMNCPPDLLAMEEMGPQRYHRKERQGLHEYLEKRRRLFVCGLALDFCVLDTCLNAKALGFEEVYIVLDASRAAWIEKVGQFGTGFLNNPGEMLGTLSTAGVKHTMTAEVIGAAAQVMAHEPTNPKTAAPNLFPQELGPLGFAVVERRGRNKVPIALKGSGQYEVDMVGDLKDLKNLGWDNKGKCSPQAALPAGWPDAPEGATSMCWAYPLADTSQPKKSASNMFSFLSLSKSAELRFALRGAFLLLSASGEVLKAQMVLPTAGLCLHFGAGEPLPDDAQAQLRDERMQVVTLPHLRKAGATHFCWVNPQEKLGAFTAPALGAFAYLTNDQKPVFFAVKEIKEAGA